MEFHIHDRMSVVECQRNSCWGKEREMVVGRRKEGREGGRRGREEDKNLSHKKTSIEQKFKLTFT